MVCCALTCVSSLLDMNGKVALNAGSCSCSLILGVQCFWLYSLSAYPAPTTSLAFSHACEAVSWILSPAFCAMPLAESAVWAAPVLASVIASLAFCSASCESQQQVSSGIRKHRWLLLCCLPALVGRFDALRQQPHAIRSRALALGHIGRERQLT